MPIAYKYVRASDRRSPHVGDSRALYYQPGETLVAQGGVGGGIFCKATRESVESRAARCPWYRVIELEYDDADLIRIGKTGTVVLARCRVVAEEGEPPVVYEPTGREVIAERAATLRAAAVIEGRRELSAHNTDDPIERLVRKKVKAARRKEARNG